MLTGSERVRNRYLSQQTRFRFYCNSHPKTGTQGETQSVESRRRSQATHRETQTSATRSGTGMGISAARINTGQVYLSQLSDEAGGEACGQAEVLNFADDLIDNRIIDNGLIHETATQR